MHLYGGAAAMLDDVMQVQWEVEVYCVSFFFCLMAAWLNEVVVRAVALLSALTKEYNMHIIQC